MKNAAEKYGKRHVGLKPQTLQLLMAYGWPGNVRQLRNVVDNMVVLSLDDNDLGPESLPAEIRPAGVVRPQIALGGKFGSRPSA